MSLARVRTLRAVQSSLRQGGRRITPRTSAPARTQLIQKRTYASGDGAHGESGSDIPWMIGAVAVTIPAAWYLWPTTSHAEHGGEHDDHEEPAEGEEKQEDASEEKQEQSSEEGEGQGGEEGEDSGAAKSSGEDGKSDGNKAEQSEEKTKETKSEGGESKDGESKDDSSDGEDKESSGDDSTGGDDSKGGEDSKDGDDSASEGRSGTSGDKSEPSGGDEPKPEKGKKQKNVTSGNSKAAHADNEGLADRKKSSQFGISTGETKHSYDITRDTSKSQKRPGVVETSKEKKTVKLPNT